MIKSLFATTSALKTSSLKTSVLKPAGTLSLLLLISATACTPATPDTDSAGDLSEGLDPVIEEPVDPTASSELGANDTETAGESNTTFAITEDGFQLIVNETGASESFEFGTDGAIAQAALINLWGDPQQSAENAECPAGPMMSTRWSNGFSINEMNGEFVGWSIDSRDAGSENLTTTEGVGIGSPLSDLDPNAQLIPDSSLGVEFFTGKVSGLISTDSPDAPILNLWAGTACIFR